MHTPLGVSRWQVLVAGSACKLQNVLVVNNILGHDMTQYLRESATMLRGNRLTTAKVLPYSSMHPHMWGSTVMPAGPAELSIAAGSPGQQAQYQAHPRAICPYRQCERRKGALYTPHTTRIQPCHTSHTRQSMSMAHAYPARVLHASAYVPHRHNQRSVHAQPRRQSKPSTTYYTASIDKSIQRRKATQKEKLHNPQIKYPRDGVGYLPLRHCCKVA